MGLILRTARYGMWDGGDKGFAVGECHFRESAQHVSFLWCKNAGW